MKKNVKKLITFFLLIVMTLGVFGCVTCESALKQKDYVSAYKYAKNDTEKEKIYVNYLDEMVKFDSETENGKELFSYLYNKLASDKKHEEALNFCKINKASSYYFNDLLTRVIKNNEYKLAIKFFEFGDIANNYTNTTRILDCLCKNDYFTTITSNNESVKSYNYLSKIDRILRHGYLDYFRTSSRTGTKEAQIKALDDIIAIYGYVMYSEYNDDWESARKMNYYDQNGYIIDVVDKNFNHYCFAEDGTFIKIFTLKIDDKSHGLISQFPLAYVVGQMVASTLPRSYLGVEVYAYFDRVPFEGDYDGAKNVINAIKKGLQ